MVYSSNINDGNTLFTLENANSKFTELDAAAYEDFTVNSYKKVELNGDKGLKIYRFVPMETAKLQTYGIFGACYKLYKGDELIDESDWGIDFSCELEAGAEYFLVVSSHLEESWFLVFCDIGKTCATAGVRHKVYF